ncbi:MAG TPA: glycoside hydrolase family 15 protein [Verrucomicrobiae bacterium]|nr:glycoside hydrolase family 15 protein [Verrucomicrobiae bacterium]
MPQEELLQYLIVEEYTPESLAKIRETLQAHGTHAIRPVEHGLFSATAAPAANSVSGYHNVWVRDNVLVANSFRLRGELAPAIACMQGLSQFFAKQRPRFLDNIQDATQKLKNDVQRRPHIRFAAQALAELPERWPHAQNDALGLALWFRFVLANSGALPLTAADWETYELFLRYFEAIEYWHDRDSGAWEEGRAIRNSSVGAVVAGLEGMREYLRSPDRQKKGDDVCAPPEVLATLDHLIEKGRARLAATLPFEAPPERLADSALLSLIYPLRVVRELAAQDAILSLVQARLKGEIGIKRYAGDSYFCQDYDQWFAPGQMSSNFSERMAYRDALLQPGCEAQWCIFDPQLSIIYGERFLANPADAESFRKQVHYFNRSLRQLTPEGGCPELYFLKDGRYVPNDHMPLLWTQANQALALHLMERSVKVKLGAGGSV